MQISINLRAVNFWEHLGISKHITRINLEFLTMPKLTSVVYGKL